jgi:hypothetical protein
VCAHGGTRMSPEVAATIIKELIQVIEHDLEQAAGLALAAEACAERGVVRDAIQIANEIDDPTHNAGRLLAVITILKRKYLTSRRAPNSDDEGDDADV